MDIWKNSTGATECGGFWNGLAVPAKPIVKKTGLSFGERIAKSYDLQLRSTGYGHCSRCGMTWDVVDGHTTPYSKSGSMFPMCEECWQETTPTERLPHYEGLWKSWQATARQHGYEQDGDWETVKVNVLAGL